LKVYLNLASRMKLTGVNQLWLWAKREEQIRGVIESTARMYGDLQCIAGKGLYEIEGLQIGVRQIESVSGTRITEPQACK
jgi:hypothetical protein